MAEEHIQQLIAARKSLTEERRKLVAELATPGEVETSEKRRREFVDIQSALLALNEAIKDEREMHSRR